MSLNSWMEEFYPCDADSPEAREAPAAHSLRKWEGLTKKNLRKHRISFDDVDGELGIDGGSCALCAVFFKRDEKGHECLTCPLSIVRGDVACDQMTSDEEVRELGAPYLTGVNGDVRPMLKWLRRAVKLEQKR